MTPLRMGFFKYNLQGLNVCSYFDTTFRDATFSV